MVADSGRKDLLSRRPSCTVLIATPDLLPTLTKRPIDPEDELLAFADADALRALEVISRRRPHIVALERKFATTPRGAALIRRIKADPALTKSEIRIISSESDDASGEPLPSVEASLAEPGAAKSVPPQPLDQRGTRRAARSRIAGTVEVIVDGNAATLVDLSAIGAQVLSAVILRPTQRLRMTLADEDSTIRFNAIVAWAAFEIPQQTEPRYRAGLEFIDANGDAVNAFRLRHKG